ncbi:cardiolipin synthase [Pseudoflavonifractor sp. 60]|uniref:cardiolipin synthase n=1 Tax=Pseudoflavonifractor sp. 60 TaxID=2304576 RepID=UPI00137138CE|nr:cardiolipin synthase [Pseudoflavonifractor sp. 60]NBI65328.1 cardiolipin synthase [Pseudoflavonifractor sp. 60]
MKKLLYILFHRSVFMSLALAVQLATLFFMVSIFSEYLEIFYWCCIAASVIAAVAIVGSRMEPGYKIAWLLLILPFPVFGGIFYLLVGGGYVPERTQKRMRGMLKKSAQALREDFKADDLLPLGGDAAGQASYLERRAACPAYTNTETEYFPLGDAAFPRMLEELEKAEKYIFLEYFIIQPGVFWDSILTILERKAAQGVEVRVLYDDFGCMFTLPRDYNETLTKKGIQCRVFNRFLPVMSLRLNNRDHRKLLIIDGKVGFTGGINLADEYINVKERFGHWKDSAVLLEGDAVWSMTVMFLTMWDNIADWDEDFERFHPPAAPVRPWTGYVQPYTDTPLDRETVGQAVYLNMIAKAKNYIYITTPYLIIDVATNTALCNAAKSGVDVRIITPHIPDKRYVFEVTRAHYPPLLESGVKIYEYTPGFIHAKNFVIDDRFATVGTVNLDYRSLFLHFEDGVWLCEAPCIRDIRTDFLKTLELSQPCSLRQFRHLNILLQLYRNILRVFAPLM